MPIIAGAPMYITSPITLITATPIMTVMYAKRRASVLSPAPIPWPVMVVAASAIPNPGI